MTHEERQDIKRRVEGYVELTDAITATMGILQAQIVELTHDINNLAEIAQLDTHADNERTYHGE